MARIILNEAETLGSKAYGKILIDTKSEFYQKYDEYSVVRTSDGKTYRVVETLEEIHQKIIEAEKEERTGAAELGEMLEVLKGIYNNLSDTREAALETNFILNGIRSRR